ncbi:MAG: FAD-dependent oxidoreductase [Steroidobacteraceae bacterium]
MNPQPASARILIIGGGIGGASAAYHLARLGARDVVLLERAMLSSGTTWHSTGNMETYRPDPLVFDMVRYAASLYPSLAQELGREIGWRNVGRIHYTDREDRWQVMQTLPELCRARGMQLDLLTPAQVQARLPIIDPAGLAGGVWIPSDARVNATDAVQALAAGARAGGVRIVQDSLVQRILARDGRVCGVETAQGIIACETLVLAAGLWSRDLAATCGVHLPMYALEHQYMITKPHGMPRDLPLFLSYEDQLYGREEVGGLMIGSLDDDAIPLSAAELPQNFSFALLNERWPQFEPYLATAMRRFPVLREVQIRMLLNGPESFTPDGQMLLGPAPGLSGLFTACGFNSNGMALAPAAGRYVAEWIVEGEPSADVAPLDVRRFSAPQATEGFMRARAAEIPGFHCRLHPLDGDYHSARNVRLSPLHELNAAAGARFVSVSGWERPAWFAPADDARLIAGVAAEVRAACGQALLVDRSMDLKCEVGSMPPSDSAPWLALEGAHGQVEALVRTAGGSGDATLISASPEQETRVLEYLRRAGRAVLDLTSSQALLELHGPARQALLAKLKEMGPPVRLWQDPVMDSTLLMMPRAESLRVWEHLLRLGELQGLRIGGHLAQEALRLQRGVPGFGSEATPARLATELGFRCAPDRPSTPAAAPRTHSPRLLMAVASDMPFEEFGAREVVMSEGRTIGELTARVRLPGWPQTLGLALLDPRQWQDGTPMETVAGGRRWPLAPRPSPWSTRLATGAR